MEKGNQTRNLGGVQPKTAAKSFPTVPSKQEDFFFFPLKSTEYFSISCITFEDLQLLKESLSDLKNEQCFKASYQTFITVSSRCLLHLKLEEGLIFVKACLSFSSLINRSNKSYYLHPQTACFLYLWSITTTMLLLLAP